MRDASKTLENFLAGPFAGHMNRVAQAALAGKAADVLSATEAFQQEAVAFLETIRVLLAEDRKAREEQSAKVIAMVEANAKAKAETHSDIMRKIAEREKALQEWQARESEKMLLSQGEMMTRTSNLMEAADVRARAVAAREKMLEEREKAFKGMKDGLSDERNRINEIKLEIDAKRTEIDEAVTENKRLRRDLAAAQRRIDEIDATERSHAKALADKQAEITKLHGVIADMNE